MERILEPTVPDLARLLERGQAGQRLLTWLGTVLGALGTGSPSLAPGAQVCECAARWLEASGLSDAASPEQRVA